MEITTKVYFKGQEKVGRGEKREAVVATDRLMEQL